MSSHLSGRNLVYRNLEVKPPIETWWYCWWFRNPAITSWYGEYPIFHKGFIDIRWCRISSINSNSRKWRFSSRSPLLKMEYTPENFNSSPPKNRPKPKKERRKSSKTSWLSGAFAVKFQRHDCIMEGSGYPPNDTPNEVFYTPKSNKKKNGPTRAGNLFPSISNLGKISFRSQAR